MATAASARFSAFSPQREAAFSRAYRHSRRVRWLRRILPFAALAVVLVVVLWSLFNPLKLLSIPASIQGLSINGSRLTMESPRMNGYTRDNRPYKVAAQKAEQDLSAPTFVELQRLSAELLLEGGATARLNANMGVIDTKIGTIKLTDQVLVTTTTGYSGRTDEALVSTEDGTITVTKPIDLASPSGHMRADMLTITERGKVMVFDGNVKGSFLPTPPDANPPAAQQ